MRISLGEDTIESGTFNFPFEEGSFESSIQLVVDDYDSYSYTASEKDLNATFELDRMVSGQAQTRFFLPKSMRLPPFGITLNFQKLPLNM